MAQITRRSFTAAGIAGATMLATGGFALSAGAQEAGTYKPGTYTGTGNGRGGNVVVEVEFDENSIKSVNVTSHSETRYISDVAIEKILPRSWSTSRSTSTASLAQPLPPSVSSRP